MKKLIVSFSHAFRGFGFAFAGERNMQIHALAALLVTVFGFLYQITGIEWVLLLLAMGMVLAAEIFNTAIEKFCNHVHPTRHPSIRNIKDLSAGAVLCTAIFAALAAAVIFIPKIASSFS